MDIKYFLTLLFLNAINSLNIAVPSSNFTDLNFKTVIDTIDASLSSSLGLIPLYVRLAFHDCIAGCNGCINIANPSNAGLKGAVVNSVGLYNNLSISSKTFYGKSISRGDFWVLCAMRAIYISSSSVTQPILNFFAGRQDCASALNDQLENLPSASKSYDQYQSMFMNPNGFNLTARETVALMGTHSIGSVVPDTSGYDGWWVVNNKIFSNSFFTQMNDTTMNYTSVGIQVTGFNYSHQWNASADLCVGKNCTPRPAAHQRIMLNSDMCLLKNFTVDSTGTPSCTYASCGLNVYTASYVKEFALSEPVFKAAFGPSFTKMVNYVNQSTSLYDLVSSDSIE